MTGPGVMDSTTRERFSLARVCFHIQPVRASSVPTRLSSCFWEVCPQGGGLWSLGSVSGTGTDHILPPPLLPSSVFTKRFMFLLSVGAPSQGPGMSGEGNKRGRRNRLCTLPAAAAGTAPPRAGGDSSLDGYPETKQGSHNPVPKGLLWCRERMVVWEAQ